MLLYKLYLEVYNMQTRQVVSFRMYASDIAAIKEKASELCISASELLRLAAMKVNERDVLDRQTLREIARR